MNNEKVINFEKLDKVSLKYKNLSLKIILCHGMFDLLHLGHIRYFNEAKKQGDILIVTLTADEYSRKGPGKPVFNEELRAESLSALEVIDYVSVCPYPTAIEAIQKVQPHIYAKGKEYEIESEDVTGMITKEREAVESYGGNIYFTDDLVFSSSSIINNEFDIFSSDVKEYLQYLKNNYDIKCIIGEMNALKSLKVLVIGEAIIDRYTYVDPLGQSGKGIHLAVRNICSEEYAGGAIAVANHVSGFVDEVALFTGLGENSEGETYESFIKEELNENVSPDIFY